jgi:SAM-dependent methyltransferase
VLEPDDRSAPNGFVFGADEPLPVTGERTSPGIREENYWFQRHVVAYRFAAGRLRGARVLDAGCGEGYGTDILARTAESVVGVDLDSGVVRRAARRYPRASFEPADIVSLPYPADSFDGVVSLQVIEHVAQPASFLQECARVLRPGGTMVLSTPNRLTFSHDGIRNPFHTFEFSPGELAALMRQHFEGVEALGTFHGWRLQLLDGLLRKPFPERLLAQPAPEWPRWLRETVGRVRPEDFRVRRTGLDRSLDLVAVARRPG